MALRLSTASCLVNKIRSQQLEAAAKSLVHDRNEPLSPQRSFQGSTCCVAKWSALLHHWLIGLSSRMLNLFLNFPFLKSCFDFPTMFYILNLTGKNTLKWITNWHLVAVVPTCFQQLSKRHIKMSFNRLVVGKPDSCQQANLLNDFKSYVILFHHISKQSCFCIGDCIPLACCSTGKTVKCTNFSILKHIKKAHWPLPEERRSTGWVL